MGKDVEEGEIVEVLIEQEEGEIRDVGEGAAEGANGAETSALEEAASKKRSRENSVESVNDNEEKKKKKKSHHSHSHHSHSHSHSHSRSSKDKKSEHEGNFDNLQHLNSL